MKPRPDRSRKLTIRPGKIIFITDRDPRLSGKSVKWTLARVARENGKLTIRRPEIVGIYSCPEFDAYLSGRGKWKSREWRLFILARWRKSAVRRILHALELRVKNMAASCGDNEKQKMEYLAEDVLTRVFVTKKLLPDFLIDMALKKKLVEAYINPANPLLDDADILISACWDQLHAIFSWPFVGYTYVHKDLPGLSKWRDAAAAIFIAFVLNDETFYSQTARPTTEHPNRRPYQLYKKRRQNLDLHPHKRPVIRGASWDRYRDVLHVNSKADGWGWEIWRFFPTQNQRD